MRGPPELVQRTFVYGGVHIGARALNNLNLIYGLATSLAYPIGEEGGILLGQIISTCLATLTGRGRDPAPCGASLLSVYCS
jgi:hypothetical protein